MWDPGGTTIYSALDVGTDNKVEWKVPLKTISGEIHQCLLVKVRREMLILSASIRLSGNYLAHKHVG